MTRGRQWAIEGEADYIRRHGGAALRVVAPSFVAGIVFDASARVSRVAPILRPMGITVGRSLTDVFLATDNRPWTLEWL